MEKFIFINQNFSIENLHPLKLENKTLFENTGGDNNVQKTGEAFKWSDYSLEKCLPSRYPIEPALPWYFYSFHRRNNF